MNYSAIFELCAKIVDTGANTLKDFRPDGFKE
jgi:hypothetical protein